MRVTKQMLSIPPYLATAWEHVAALRVEGAVLIVKMMDGTHAEVPGLSGEQLQAVFAAHADYLESTAAPDEAVLPFKLMGNGFEAIGATAQHDPANANAPDLPKEMLAKIGQISEALGVGTESEAPEAVEGCNCFHCQIAAAIAGRDEEPILEEEISEEELKFCNWDIESTGDKMYLVTSRLNKSESFHVHLGEPVGCTCGEAHCEHIKAVLES